MFDVWIVDFVSHKRWVFRKGLKWKKAKKLIAKMNKKDHFSVAITVPSGFLLG